MPADEQIFMDAVQLYAPQDARADAAAAAAAAISAATTSRATAQHATAELIAGAFAGSSAIITGFPFDTVKCRMQSGAASSAAGGGKAPGMVQVASGIIKANGVRGLFRGMTPPLVGGAAETAISYLVYSEVLAAWKPSDAQRSPMHHVPAAAAAAGVALSFVLGPVELVKCRMQAAGSVYSSPWHCLQHTVANEGWRGLTRGLGATLMREVPGNAVFFSVYEGLRRYVLPRPHQPPPHQPAPVGGGASSSSSSSSSSRSGMSSSSKKLNCNEDHISNSSSSFSSSHNSIDRSLSSTSDSSNGSSSSNPDLGPDTSLRDVGLLTFQPSTPLPTYSQVSAQPSPLTPMPTTSTPHNSSINHSMTASDANAPFKSRLTGADTGTLTSLHSGTDTDTSPSPIPSTLLTPSRPIVASTGTPTSPIITPPTSSLHGNPHHHRDPSSAIFLSSESAALLSPILPSQGSSALLIPVYPHVATHCPSPLGGASKALKTHAALTHQVAVTEGLEVGHPAVNSTLMAALVDAASSIIAGGVAGVVMWSAVLPIDVAKTRLQIATPGGAWDIGVLAHLRQLRKEGRLYAGLAPTLTRAFPANAVQFLAWEFAMRQLAPVDR